VSLNVVAGAAAPGANIDPTGALRWRQPVTTIALSMAFELAGAAPGRGAWLWAARTALAIHHARHATTSRWLDIGSFKGRFRVPGSGFRVLVLGSGFRVPGSGSGFWVLVPGSRFLVLGSGFSWSSVECARDVPGGRIIPVAGGIMAGHGGW
jgi:hypothetical protein